MKTKIATGVLVGLFSAWAYLTFSGRLFAFDLWGLALFRDGHGTPIGGAVIPKVIVMVTHLGDTVTLIVLALFVLGWLILRRHIHTALMGFFAIAGLFILNPILKTLFGRERPDVFDHVVHASTNSFPSGHALRAAGIYFLIYCLLVNRVPLQMTQALFWLFAAIAISTGLSRVYLGVHWPTDIVASWLVAATWVLYWRERLSPLGGEAKKG